MVNSLSDRTEHLRSLMQQAQIPNFRALSRAAEVSDWQVRQLRQGRVHQLRLEVLLKLSQALQVSLPELLMALGVGELSPNGERSPLTIDELRQEYDRLQAQFTQQREHLGQEFQQNSLQVLESWLLQWPTAAYAAQQNPQAPAVKLLPLLRPVERLLQEWGVEAIATIGAEIPYDPQQHQLITGHAQPGDLVQVTHVGYRHQGKLLHRAKVKPSQT